MVGTGIGTGTGIVTGTELFPTCYECRLIWLHLLTGYGPKTWPWQGSEHFERLPWCCHGIGTVCVVLASSLCRNRGHWCKGQCQGVGWIETALGCSWICCRRNICPCWARTSSPTSSTRSPPTHTPRPSPVCFCWKLLQSRSYNRRQSTPSMYWREAIIKNSVNWGKPGTHLYNRFLSVLPVYRWVPGLTSIEWVFYDGFPPVHTRRRLTPSKTSTLQFAQFVPRGKLVAFHSFGWNTARGWSNVIGIFSCQS